MSVSGEVVIRLTEEQREEIRKATGKAVSSVVKIEMVIADDVTTRSSTETNRAQPATR